MSGLTKKDAASQVQGPGSQLGVAREAKGLDLQKTAKMLHLTVETVRHLESDAYELLPARVFIRGYLRNYARLVELPESTILAQFDKSCPDRECSPILPNVSRGIKAEVGSNHVIVRLITWVLIIGVIISIVLSFQGHIVQAWEKLQTMGSTVSVQQDNDSASGNLMIPVLEEKIVMVPMSESEREAGLQPIKSSNDFVIHFTGPVWVDIRDKSEGFRLTGDMPAGSSKKLQGEPPFTIMVSDYEQMAITIDGEAFDLAPHLENLSVGDQRHLQFVVP